jgi:hypothetical protein
MTAMLLAQLGGYSIAQIAIAVLIILGVVGIVWAVTKHLGIAIPPIVVTIFWIVFAVALGIMAIRFLMSL